MSFKDTCCDRDGCHHNVPDHPKDGKCDKCNCVGFLSKNNYHDPISEHYLKQIVDTHVAFTSELDTGRHLVQDFPIMSEWFLQQKDEKTKEFWKKLVQEKPILAENVNKKILEFNKSGMYGNNNKLSKDESEVIHRLCFDGSNRDQSLVFVKNLILLLFATRFREFIREILTIVIEIQYRKRKENLDRESIKKEIENYGWDMKKMMNKLANKWKLILQKELDYDQFLEIFYRRDIFVHNRGFPDEKYRKLSGYSGSDEEIKLTDEYLMQLMSILEKYSDLVYEYFIEKELGMVNINKKGNSHHIDLVQTGGRIIPIKDESKKGEL